MKKILNFKTIKFGVVRSTQDSRQINKVQQNLLYHKKKIKHKITLFWIIQISVFIRCKNSTLLKTIGIWISEKLFNKNWKLQNIIQCMNMILPTNESDYNLFVQSKKIGIFSLKRHFLIIRYPFLKPLTTRCFYTWRKIKFILSNQPIPWVLNYCA